PAPSTAASRPMTGSPTRRSATTPAATSPNACVWARFRSSVSCGWPRGRTCSASAATSPPRAAPTPPPLGALRADRAAHQRQYAIAAGLLPDLDGDTTLVINDWHFAGRGHLLVAALASDILSHAPPAGGPP